jgi:outer membrane beta-barrel protein
MGARMRSILVVILFATTAITLGVTNAHGSDLLEDFDSLGGNAVLLEKARALNPDAKINIVQDRIVNRRNRFELAPEYSSVLGGDSYNKTQNLGMNAHFHINPHWSIGAKYNYSINELRPEGENLINDLTLSGRGIIPEIDYPKSQILATLNWYPIYGKLNVFDLGVVHFDVYTLAGAGKIDLKSGATKTYTAGGGIGFWVSQHLSTRMEVRYQAYDAKRYTGLIRMDTTVASMQIGYLL